MEEVKAAKRKAREAKRAKETAAVAAPMPGIAAVDSVFRVIDPNTGHAYFLTSAPREMGEAWHGQTIKTKVSTSKERSRAKHSQ